MWHATESPLVNFLMSEKTREHGCGDVYINIADYSAPDFIKNQQDLVPFMKNVRASGNRAVILLVYGDVNVSGNGVLDGPQRFADTFFRWLNTVSQEDLEEILPLGISFDCEHLPHATITGGLNTAQSLKKHFADAKLGGDASKIFIEWTIEGDEKPNDTDIVMKLADRALVMTYRNRMFTGPVDAENEDDLAGRFFNFMLKRQCTNCLNDIYAREHYKAKMKIMVEADCECGSGCEKISFCAFDAKANGWGNGFSNGAEYLVNTLRQFDSALRDGSRITKEQFQRLFGDYDDLGLFVVHNWNWYTCYFDDRSVDISYPIGARRQGCRNYHSLAAGCRSL